MSEVTVNMYWTMMVNRELFVTHSAFAFFMVNSTLALENKAWPYLKCLPINGFHFLLVKFLTVLAGVVFYILLLPLWIKSYTIVLKILLPDYHLIYNSQILLIALGATFYCSLTFLILYVWRRKIRFSPLIFLISLFLGIGLPIAPNSLFLSVSENNYWMIYAAVYALSPVLVIAYLFKNAYDRNRFKN